VTTATPRGISGRRGIRVSVALSGAFSNQTDRPPVTFMRVFLRERAVRPLKLVRRTPLSLPFTAEPRKETTAAQREAGIAQLSASSRIRLQNRSNIWRAVAQANVARVDFSARNMCIFQCRS